MSLLDELLERMPADRRESFLRRLHALNIAPDSPDLIQAVLATDALESCLSELDARVGRAIAKAFPAAPGDRITARDCVGMIVGVALYGALDVLPHLWSATTGEAWVAWLVASVGGFFVVRSFARGVVGSRWASLLAAVVCVLVVIVAIVVHSPLVSHHLGMLDPRRAVEARLY